jgi:hypothetical protein
MATQITRTQILTDRVITVTISLTAKDATDDALVKKFGDIQIMPSGYFNDPADSTYPQFMVNAGTEPIDFFTAGSIVATFANDTLALADLQRRALLWGNAIQLTIQNAMIALRALVDSTTSTSVVTI